MRPSSIAVSLVSLAKLRFALVALAALSTTPSHAADTVAYVSATGSGNSCTPASPCSTVTTAYTVANSPANYPVQSPARIICLDGTAADPWASAIDGNGPVLDVDCPKGIMAGLTTFTTATNMTVRIRHLSFWNSGYYNFEILIQGSGTVTFEDCVFTDAPGAAIDLEPTGPLTIVIRNSRIANGSSGMLFKPAAGGSINATLDHVVVTNNAGGGIKADSTNGAVNLDITNSEISNNGGNGINLVGAVNQTMLNLGHTVIAKNGVAGLQASGATAAALVDTTLFDTNTSGATSAIGGGRIVTYGDNHIVGSSGSGFTGTAPAQ
jgi:hypothetical protein